MANQQNEIENMYNEGSGLSNAKNKISKYGGIFRKLFGPIGRLLGRTVGRAILLALGAKAFVVIAVVVAVILILIILIGIVSFILMGPAGVAGRIVQFADDLFTSVEGFVYGQDVAQVKKEDVVKIASYLDNMGFKLEGYGFAEKEDIERDDNGEVTDLDSSYLVAYLAAENKTYMIANQNFNLRDYFNDVGFTPIISGIPMAKKIINDAVNGDDGSWGSGMIVINRNLWQKTWSSNDLEKNVTINRKEKVMEIKMKPSNNGDEVIYQYNLDGWMGRYGKPIEFLLALHIGTMAPDFAYEVATGDDFDTKVYIRFRMVGTKVKLKYNGRYVVSYKDDKGQYQEGWDKYVNSYASKMGDSLRKYNRELSIFNAQYPDAEQPLFSEQEIQAKVNEACKNAYGLTPSDISAAEAYEEKENKRIYKPYIRAVNNHWFRDLDFSDAYRTGFTKKLEGEKTIDGSDVTFTVEGETDDDIFQVAEPKIVGKAIDKLIVESIIDGDDISVIDAVKTKATTNATVDESGDIKIEESESDQKTLGAGDNAKQSENNGSSQPKIAALTNMKQGAGVWAEGGDWGSKPYSSGTMATAGCIPTSFAMVATWATGKFVSPSEAADYATHNGWVGNYTDYFPAAAKKYKFTLTGTSDKNKVIEALKQGKAVLAGHDGPSDFSSGKSGHWVVYRGIDSEGNLLINNPGRNGEDDKKWDLDYVLNHKNPYWFIPYDYPAGATTTETSAGSSGTSVTGTGTSGGGSSTESETYAELKNKTTGNIYEGYRLDELFKKKYRVANGMDGISEEEYELKIRNTMRYAIAMLENVGTLDSQYILRDLKRYLSKRGFTFDNQYVITNPENWKKEDDKIQKEYDSLKYEGTRYVTKGFNDMDGKTSTGAGARKNYPLGSILNGGMKGAEVKSDEKKVILHHQSGDYPDGFKTGDKVLSPGAGTINVKGNTVEIKLTTKGVENYTVRISGFKPTVETGSKVKKGNQIGTTTDGDIEITMKDANGNAVNPADYLPFIVSVNASDEDIDYVARCIQAEANEADPQAMAAVAWCIINRYNDKTGWGRNATCLKDIVMADGQFEVTWNHSSRFFQNALPLAIQVAKSCIAGTMSNPCDGHLINGENYCFRGKGQFSASEIQNLQSKKLAYQVNGGNVFFHAERDVK